MILMALQWGGVTYPWNSGRIIGLFVGAGVILIFFAIWQWHVGEQGMFPKSIMSQRTVLWASLAASFAMGGQGILPLWLPEWFQAIKGVSPVNSGIRLLPTMVAQIISSLVSGALITVFGYFNPWLLTGTALMSIGSGLIATFDLDTASSKWIGYQVIYGLGAGMFQTVPLIAIQAVLDAARTPVGIATVSFFQFFGSAFYVAISQTIFNEQLVKQLAENAPNVDVAKLLAAGTANIRNAVTPDQVHGVLQSYNTAMLDSFYLAAAICAVGFFCSFGLEWVSVKGKDLAAGGVA